MSESHAPRLHRILDLVGSPWAIERDRLEAIVELMELRARGVKLTPEEREERIRVYRRERETPLVIAPSRSTRDRRERDNGNRKPYEVFDSVAVIGLHGVLAPKINLMMEISGGTSTQAFSTAVATAAEDREVEAILLDIDSPGGSVYGTPEAFEVVFAARAVKPVIAVGTGMMTSGAYYIASAATEVAASPSTMTGSIGVISIYTDESEARAKAGVKQVVFRSGRYKALDYDEPMTDEGKKAIQERLDDHYSMFIHCVARGRGVTPQTVLEKFGEGKSFIAHRALAMGMIDRITTLQEVFDGIVRGNRTARQQRDRAAMADRIAAWRNGGREANFAAFLRAKENVQRGEMERLQEHREEMEALCRAQA